MLKRIAAALIVLAVVGAGAFWLLTMPQRVDAAALPDASSGDAARGERVFWMAGCASCHSPSAAKGPDRLKLGGGDPIRTKFGTFYPPNISPDPKDGIGSWQFADFVNALQRGVSPDGRHYYPAFPYTSFARMKPQDVADLFAYLKTLPPVSGKAPTDAVSFPFNIRRGIGLWKRVFLHPDAPIVALSGDAGAVVKAGQYIVEGPGHCGECHTPRSLGGAGGLDHDSWLAGAPNPDGKGRIPNITPSKAGIGSWSATEISDYLQSGFTPDFDTVGGLMVEVQQNIARLPKADRDAIAAYLKAIPPRG